MKRLYIIALSLALSLLSTVPARAAEASIEQLANAQSLRLLSSGYQGLDDLATEVLDSIISDNMTQYQKLIAAYDYCTTSFTYDTPIIYRCANGTANCPVAGPHSQCAFTIETRPFNDTVYVGDHTLLGPSDTENAYRVLQSKIGVCDDYAAAFAALANAIGFEAYVAKGEIKLSSGQWAGHAWTVVRLGDSFYIFDPQAEQVNMKNGVIQYRNFGLSGNSASYQMWDYYWESSKEWRAAFIG